MSVSLVVVLVRRAKLYYVYARGQLLFTEFYSRVEMKCGVATIINVQTTVLLFAIHFYSVIYATRHLY
jgi:hypothetical protein